MMEDWEKAYQALPGEPYLQVLEKIHAALKPKTYLEIGVQYGFSFCLAGPQTFAVGVDPNPCIQTDLHAWSRIYRQTSEAFFISYPGDPFDLIFIDGLHQYEAIVDDFCNAEQYCTPQSIILIHDTIPLSAESSKKDFDPGFWTGDVWKIVPTLLQARPDLTIFTIACPPSGLTVIKGFGKSEGISSEVVDQFREKEYAWIESQKKTALGVVENREDIWMPLLLNKKS
ncbi:class I SAM-dependent methyltransferase [Parachlamydia acanthamoebae]|uniref:class I SAM-dependent methyltransferase n=1 Tax=Parachlamydia acanthamoebae TaxID=83552 RepID=UPI000750E6EC|nr:class I SAM-dependent methyltransferase [Parachlamydia acanthamoebae]